MSMSINQDYSVTFNSDNGNGATLTFPPGTPQAQIDAAYLAFQAANPVAAPPPAIVILPMADPGVTGAMFLKNNALNLSQGSSTPIQIGATGGVQAGVL